MYLKRLEMIGFKSFATRTVLEFAPGVTGVVGPNGAGKSNIADALRFVLGEHASRGLRARKTEDVIFSGSHKRAPLGMAEVSITLDNADHWLPVDFSEVVVTRRALRSGENEYFINRSRVRLRDVVDLFLRAQVGQNSYAFMGQGLAEAILSLRPEERRLLIEEAADVRLYRSKMEEARDRLAATRENLDRVLLLVAEIEPRLTQLRRQAERAEQHERLSRELAAALRVWYAHQWTEAQEALAAARALCDQRLEERQQASAEARTFEEAASALVSAIEERRADIAERERSVRALSDRLRELERRVALDEERSRSLAARREELSAELVGLREELGAMTPETGEPADDALAARIRAAREELAARRREAEALEADTSELRRAAAAAESALARVIDAQDEGRARIRRLKELEAAAARRLGALTEERRAQIGELAAWARAYRDAYLAARPLAADLERAIAARDEVRRRVEEARSGLQGLEEEARALRSRVESLEVRLQVLEAIEVKPQTPDAGIRSLLAAGGLLPGDAPGSLEGVLGLVGQLLKVPPGLEKAIEAALAENLYAVVVEREGHARAAVELLLSGDHGRATIYALETVQEVRPLNLMKERGILGVASQLVRCDGRHRRLVDTLLGRTIVVEDLALARTVLRRGMGSVVTLDGVLLRPVGSLSAGSNRLIAEAFAHHRELDEIPAELERLRPLLHSTEGALRERYRTLEEGTRNLESISATVEDVQHRWEAAEAGLRTVRRRLPDHARRLLQTREQLASAATRLADIRADLARAEDEQRALADRAATAPGEVERARAAVAEAEQRARPLREAAMAAASAVATLEGEQRLLEQTRQRAEAARRRLEAQVKEKEERLAAASSEMVTVQQRLAAEQEEAERRQQEYLSLLSDLEPARRELEQLESRQRTITGELAEAQSRLRAAERGLADAQSHVGIRLKEVEALRATLEAEGFQPESLLESEGGAGAAAPTWLMAEADGDGASDLPPIRGAAEVDPAELKDRIGALRAQIRALGPVNEQASGDYAESRERYEFLTGQLEDLRRAEGGLRAAIKELEDTVKDRFRATFRKVNREFERYFTTFFSGGSAKLVLGEPDEHGLPGVEIVAQPPGKRLGSLALMSGGERSLTAVALLFALLRVHPSPICVLDEADAALDEANVGRFTEALRDLARRTQFVVITHNRRTIEMADAIYGVSMGDDATSRVLSLRLSDLSKN